MNGLELRGKQVKAQDVGALNVMGHRESIKHRDQAKMLQANLLIWETDKYYDKQKAKTTKQSRRCSISNRSDSAHSAQGHNMMFYDSKVGF